MTKTTIALTGLAMGAGLMYLIDPQEGNRRRARVRDAAKHTAHTVQDAAGTASRDLSNRVAGLGARTAAALATAAAVSDEVLAARVRARVGRLVSHPVAIGVSFASGRVTLKGPLFDAEVGQLMDGVLAVAGVTGIENHLEPHAHADDIPALQGTGPLYLGADGPTVVRWTPTTRVAAAAAGLTLLAMALRHRSIRDTAVSLAGFELLEQAVRGARAA